MQINAIDFIDERIDDITASLRETNGEYAKAAARQKELSMTVNNIIMRDSDTLLVECDRLDFREYFDHELTVVAIEQQAIYRQGLLDCVAILKSLGVIA